MTQLEGRQSHVQEEPCAGNLLAGICGGLRGVIPSFYPDVTFFSKFIKIVAGHFKLIIKLTSD